MGGEVISEAVLNVGDVGINDGCGLFGGLFLAGFVEVLHEFLGGAHGHVAAENLIGGGELLGGIFDAEDGFGVSDGEVAVGDVLLNGFLEVEEADGVGHAGPGFADAAGNDVLLEAEVLGEADVARGFFDGVEILALQVLDEGHFEDFLVGGRALDDGDGGESEELAGAPAAFTGNEFHLVTHLPDDEGLDDAEFGDGLLELVEGLFGKLLSRLQRGGDNMVKRNLNDRLSGKEFDFCLWS